MPMKQTVFFYPQNSLHEFMRNVLANYKR